MNTKTSDVELNSIKSSARAHSLVTIGGAGMARGSKSSRVLDDKAQLPQTSKHVNYSGSDFFNIRNANLEN